MELLFVLLTSIALGVDSLVAMFVLSKSRFSYSRTQILCLALIVGLFHFLMPLVGSLLSLATISFISNFSCYISAAVFVFLGVKMIVDSSDKVDVPAVSSVWKILIFAYLLSVDALASGFSYSIIDIDLSIYFVALFFSVVAFAMSLLGFCIGRFFFFINHRVGCIIGGVVLIILGLKDFIF